VIGKQLDDVKRKRWMDLLLESCDEIKLADDPEFRAGMSVIADIDTGHGRSWHELF